MLHVSARDSKGQSEGTRTPGVGEWRQELVPPIGGLDIPQSITASRSRAASSAAQLRPHFAALQQTVGNQAVLQMLSRTAQPQSMVPSSPLGTVLQRKCACDESGSKCESCKQKPEAGILHRKESGASSPNGMSPTARGPSPSRNAGPSSTLENRLSHAQGGPSGAPTAAVPASPQDIVEQADALRSGILSKAWASRRQVQIACQKQADPSLLTQALPD
jgi:hypothetical protein